MYKSIGIYIGLRYLRNNIRISSFFEFLISYFSAIGITLSIIALVTILSIMNGFEKYLEKNILSLIPQVLITTSDKYLNPDYITASSLLLSMQNVNNIAPLTTGKVILQSAKQVSAGIMLGINPNFYEPLSSCIIHTDIFQLQSGKYFTILGKKLAEKLNVKIGDKVKFIIPEKITLTPIGIVPRQRLFTVLDLYSVNSEVEEYQVLINQKDASRIMHYPSESYITGWRLWIKNPIYINNFWKKNYNHKKKFVVQDWRQSKGELFNAINMEKNIMCILLMFIILLSSLNTVTSLGMHIIEKKYDIAILRTYGLTRLQIILIFVIQGATFGILASLFGTIIGILFVMKINFFIPIQDIYLPIYIKYSQIFFLTLFSIFISVISTLYPSWYASYINPANTLTNV